MYIVNEEDKEYRFGDSGPKYLMKGPRMNFALVQFQAGQDFKAHYHNVMEENFYILEGEVDIVVDGVVNHLRPGQMIHIEPGEIHYVVNNSGAPMKMISTLAPYTNPDKVDVENYTYSGGTLRVPPSNSRQEPEVPAPLLFAYLTPSVTATPCQLPRRGSSSIRLFPI